MNDIKLDIAFWNYDRTRPLADGTVKIDGVDATFHTARIVTEIFEGMLRDRKYDVSELGLTYFLRAFDADDSLVAIPIFPNRAFRHSAIYINTTKGIAKPEDLAGKTIGELALYGHDAGVIPKGILSDEYGVQPNRCRWVVGGIDFPLNPLDFVSHPHPADVEVSHAPPGADLGEMLESGQIDALISADIPKCILEKRPTVGRLFEDYESIERAYFERTGIFPIMHTVRGRAIVRHRQPGGREGGLRGLLRRESRDDRAIYEGHDLQQHGDDATVVYETGRRGPRRTRRRLVALRP